MTLRQFRRDMLYWIAQWCVELLTKRTVAKGPFAGLRYPDHVRVGNALHAKWLGCYEAEIIDFWSRLALRDFTLIVDVGAAEGFYVVGLAKLFPKANVVGFETGETERDAIRQLAGANGTTNVVVMGQCDIHTLSVIGDASISGDSSALLVMDVEGAEYDLLEPSKVAWLTRATILVECHHFSGGSGAEMLKQRFGATHRAETVKSRQRSVRDLPWRCPRILQKWLLHVSSDQREGEQEWLMLCPTSA
jgi:hypothetical protein